MSGFIRVSLSLIYLVPSPTQNNTGKVPKANAPVIVAHSTKLPDWSAKSCILWVNPQGSKKVKAHTNRAYFGFLRLNNV